MRIFLISPFFAFLFSRLLKFYVTSGYVCFLITDLLSEKNVTRKHEGEGGGGGLNRNQLPFIFRSIQPIDMKFVMFNKCLVYFQLSQLNKVTWYLIGFYANRSIEMTFPSVKMIFNDIHPIDIKST